ncbi:MAG: GntR family transcriptional regulator, partial [Microbacterium chocolatum]|nr:GntR family transcriptional regulator [Microbacterium chocolatum]
MLRNDRDALSGIRGGTANEIAESLRERMERGLLGAGDALPPVRALAEALDVNRNTVMAAYRQLAQAGLVVSRGRAGTHVTGPATVAQDGFAADTVLRDVGTGNPDPARIPDPTSALTRIVGRPVLYGEPVIDRDLEAWADEWMRAALPPEKPMRLTITSGASDAIDRLLSTYLTRDDGVALEDPCFLASLNTVRLGGYRAVPVPVDDEGMTVDGLRAALADGVRAVVCTPRAQNPTGASITERRAGQLRAELAAHELPADVAGGRRHPHPQVQPVTRRHRQPLAPQGFGERGVPFGVVDRRRLDARPHLRVRHEGVGEALQKVAHPGGARTEPLRQSRPGLGIGCRHRQAHVGTEELRHRPDQGPPFVVARDDRGMRHPREEGEVIVLDHEHVRMR